MKYYLLILVHIYLTTHNMLCLLTVMLASQNVCFVCLFGFFGLVDFFKDFFLKSDFVVVCLVICWFFGGGFYGFFFF